MPSARVYVIDDDPAMRDSLDFLLGSAGFDVRLFDSAQVFLDELANLEAGCIVTDVRMPGIDGMDFEPERPRSGFGKPPALAAPRDGGKDNLRQIAGVTPDLEASLNHLGIYHYDQVASWDHKAVVWLDHHLTLRGRIGREKWIDQARALMARRPATARPVRR